jgi:hypothetical protein
VSVNVLIDPKVIADQMRDELLATDAIFSDPSVTVISADPGDIETQINSALQQLALGVIIAPVSFKSTVPNLPGPFFDKVKMSIFVTENNTLNRQGDSFVTAQNLTVLVAAALHRFAPAGINERVIVTDILPVPFPKPDDDNQPTLNMWYVEGTCGGGIGYNKGVIAPVTFASVDSTHVTLSCVTPGAAIWFTLDGSHPNPANPTAHLAVMQQTFLLGDDDITPILTGAGQPIVTIQMSYPVPVSAGKQLLARAWRSGLNPTTPDVQTYQN